MREKIFIKDLFILVSVMLPCLKFPDILAINKYFK